jgi:signal transduction histidine kinase
MVNISLVNFERNIIETKHIKGKELPSEKEHEFKSRAVHSLDSKDIQADIVRKRKVEVPEYDDERFDAELAEDFGHETLIRIFIPMIEAAKYIVIGTVECSYKKEYRDFIYERDVQILEKFVNHAVQALEKRKKYSIEMIVHELHDPILGIRNRADKLLRQYKGMPEEKIYVCLEDMISDCELLFTQVRQLDMIGTNKTLSLSIQPVSVYKEIPRILHKLRSLIRYRDFDKQNIDYLFSEEAKYIEISTDRGKLIQIIDNLVMNSIKYSRNCFDFKITGKVEQEFIKLNFQDNGMGVEEEEKEKVFQPGFRGLKAKQREQGSGMGLSISKDLAAKIGGDLVLVNCRNPTEFELKIPIHIPIGEEGARK